jgi:16S rRNA (guanine527-N7)-methyltransferase
MDDAVLGALAEARALGFLGPGPLELHVASAEAFRTALGPLDGPALDLGSGGGVPGLLLAASYPAVAWTLLDQQRRRTSFLARTVAQLNWVGRVDVVRAAAEEAAHDPRWRERFVAVTSRSFGPPAITAEIAAAFLAPEGRLLVAEPPEPDERRWPADGLRRLGLARLPPLDAPIAVFRPTRGLDPDQPRRWRQLQQHPVW